MNIWLHPQNQSDWLPGGSLPGGRTLGTSAVELGFVHGPDGALHVLNPHEALVQRQVVAYRVLNGKVKYYT